MTLTFKKLAVLTESPPQNAELVTYRDNLINNANNFLTTKYPWLDNVPSIDFVEMKPEDGYAYAFATLTFPNTKFVLQFPIIFSDGEFLDIPALYSPDTKQFFPFTKDWYDLIATNLSEDSPMGRSSNRNNPVDGTEEAYTQNYNSALSLSNPNNPMGKYCKLLPSSMLSLIPEKYLKGMLKTAASSYPGFINPLYSALRLKNIKYNSRIHSLTKKASSSPSPKKSFLPTPIPVFTKTSQILDLPNNVIEKYGTDKYSLLENLEKYSYAALDKDTVEYGVHNKEKIIPSEVELKSSSNLATLLNNLRPGKPFIVEDAVTTKINVFLKPFNLTNLSRAGRLGGEIPCTTICDGSPSTGDSIKNPEVSLNTISRSVPTDKKFPLNSINHLINIYGYARRDSTLNKLFTENLSLSYIKKMITSIYGKFELNKEYDGYNSSFLPFMHNKKIFTSILPSRYFKFMFVDQNNGFTKLNLVDFISKNEPTRNEKIYVSFLINKETDKVHKIKVHSDSNIHILTNTDTDFRVIPLDVIDPSTFTQSDDTTLIFKKDSELENINIIKAFNYDSESIVQETLGDANDLISSAIKGVPITVKYFDSTTEGSYELIYNSNSYAKKIPLKIASRTDVASLLGMVGIGHKSIETMIKSAETVGENTIAMVPPQTEQKSDANYEAMLSMFDSQMKMMFEFMKDKLDNIEKGVADKDELLSKQLELFEEKLESIDELKVALEATPQAPMEQGPVEGATQGSDQSMDPSTPTIDDQTANIIAQSLADPSVAQQNGIDPQTAEMLDAALQGDVEAAAQAGLNEADIYLITQAFNNIQMTDPSTDPNQGAPMDPSQGASSDPNQIQEIASILAQSLLDPTFAQQQGVTEEDLNYARQIISNPDAAVQQGEDPALVESLTNNYNMMSQEINMQNTSGQVEGATPMSAPGMEQMAPVASNMEDSGMVDEAELTRGLTTLVDLIPKVKSTKLFFKYINNFKTMLSILGELLFSLEIQSTKYKKLLGEDSYSDTIYLLQQLYEQFGDFILKMYTIEK